MLKRWGRLLNVVGLLALWAGFGGAGVAAAICPGDCNGDGTVTAASLTKIISIMLLCPGEPATGCAAVPGDDKQCTAADINSDGTISASEMTTVIQNMINYDTGCPPEVATPTVPPAQPTATRPPATATVPPAPTATQPPAPTATQPAAATATQPPAATATQPPAATPTSPPVATPTTGGGTGLGVRVFTINSKTSVSKFFTSVLTGLSVTTGITGTITLVAGAQNPDGTVPLTLQDDAYITVPLIQGQGTVCFKLFKEGTHGTLDCDGGSPADVTVTVDSHGTGTNDAPVWTVSGTGSAGSATLTVIQAGTTPQTGTIDCTKQTFGTPSTVIYTTGKTTATIVNPIPGSPPNPPPPTPGSDKTISSSATGKSFSCATWTTTDSAGALVNSVLGLDAVTSPGTAPVDTVNTLLIVDQ